MSAPTLNIVKVSSLVWRHEFSDQFDNINGKFTFSEDGDLFQLIRNGQSKSNKYNFVNITVTDEITSTVYNSFVSPTALALQLEVLGYIGFDLTTGISDAPIDGNTYARKDGAWILITGGSAGFSLQLQWDGTSDITVPAGFSGKVFNENINEFATYTVSGTDLTITGNAYSNDFLTLTS